MKVMHVVGNRPQFIKLAPVSRELKRRNIKEIIIHTGQHYNENMSDIFFKELGIPEPTKNLNIGSGTHAQVTAKAMIELEKVMLKLKPDCVLVYGDTNSTLAATLTAAKLCIPIIHIEAGPRTYNKKNPEECNRIVVDHLSTYLCTPDKNSVENLKREGISEENIYFTGDVMYDEFLYCASQEEKEIYLKDFPKNYILMTWHRQENTDDSIRVNKMIELIEKVKYPIILPLHPRTRKILKEYGLEKRLEQVQDLMLIEPVGYVEMVILMKHCKLIISDSGGASKEASFIGKKCIYTLNLKVWPELIDSGNIQIVDIENEKEVERTLKVIEDVITGKQKSDKVDFFGNGNAAVKIVDIIEKNVN